MGKFVHLAILLTIANHFPFSVAQSIVCELAADFANPNATGTYTMPALTINRTEEQDPNLSGEIGGLVEDSGKTWIFSPYLNADAALHTQSSDMWFNTGDSNMTDIGMCMTQAVSIGLGEYAFSKEVLLRSVDDNGDCKTMLGESCVAALQAQYRQQATSAMMSGGCSGQQGTPVNSTVPWECADLVGGGESWLGGAVFTTVALGASFTAPDLAEHNCDNTTQPLNSSMKALSNIRTPYNQTIRFPQLWFLSFWPNRSSVSNTYQDGWDNDVHAEIRCMKTGDVVEGSFVPPSAQELMDSDDAVFAKNLSGMMEAVVGAEEEEEETVGLEV